MKERSIEQVQNDLDARCGGQKLYVVLEKKGDKVKVIHKRCNGEPFERELSNFYSKIKRGTIDVCPYCQGIKKIGHKIPITELQKELENSGNENEYIIIGGKAKKLEVKHTRCGSIFTCSKYSIIERIKRGHHKCPGCDGRHKSPEEIVDLFLRNGYITNKDDVVNNYKNYRSKIPCLERSNPSVQFQLSVDQLCKRKNKAQNYSRPVIDAARANEKIKERYGEEMVEIVKANGYLLNCSGYCLRCGYKINEKFKNVIRRFDPCKVCSIQSGFEKGIDGILLEINGMLRASSKPQIEYSRDYVLSNECKSKKELHFDFAFFKSEEVVLTIECDLDRNHKYNKYTIERDKIKDDYCEGRVPLVRLTDKATWYRDFINALCNYGLIEELMRDNLINKDNME